MLIIRLLMARGRRHFEAPECWRLFSVSGWPEVCRASTKACKQVWAKNYSRTERHYLVKITSWMIYNQINLSQKEPYKCANVTSEHFSFLLPAFESSNLDYFPISMISGIFRDYYCGFFGYCSKHYTFKNIFWGWTVPLSLRRTMSVYFLQYNLLWNST